VLWVLRRGERLKRVREVGGAAASRFSGESGRGRGQGRGMGPCSFFHKAKAVGQGGALRS
jgi:hypothetical protein